MTRDEQRFRAAEAALWFDAGATPTERWIRLPRLGVRVRIQEVGSGVPTLFLHGGPNAGSTWAYLVARLSGLRCLLVDRPGTGLSEPYRVDLDNASGFVDTLLPDLLDALELDRAHVVGSSFGGWIALRGAGVAAERVDRMVQMACPAMAPGFLLPPFMRALTFPGVAAVTNALPPNARVGRVLLRQIGHGASLDAGRIPQAFLDWYLALQRYTDTFPNETGVITRCSSFRGGFDPSLTLTDDQLAAVLAPVLWLWGAHDSFGGEAVARNLAAKMPHVELEMLPDGGHLPWLDDPDHVAARMHDFLVARTAPASPSPASR